MERFSARTAPLGGRLVTRPVEVEENKRPLRSLSRESPFLVGGYVSSCDRGGGGTF